MRQLQNSRSRKRQKVAAGTEICDDGSAIPMEHSASVILIALAEKNSVAKSVQQRGGVMTNASHPNFFELG